MRRTALFLIILAGLLSTEGLAEGPDGDPEADGARILNDLTAANAAKDSSKIDLLLKEILDYAKRGKTEETIEEFGAQLDESFKICKGNWGTLRKIVEAMGELRSKKGSRLLKKVAFQKEGLTKDEEEVQAVAIHAISLMNDPKMVASLIEQTRNKSLVVAKAAYESFKQYATAKGKVRRDIADELIKRLEAENPTAGQSGGVSAEQQDRFNQLKASIVASMQVICRQPTINDVENWREWWRENKKNSRAEAWKDPEKE